MLACPRCGMRFTLGLPSAAPPPGQSTGTVGPQGTVAGMPVPPPTIPNMPGITTTTPGYSARPTGYQSLAAPFVPGTNSTYATTGGIAAETSRIDGLEEPRSPVRTTRLQTFLLVCVTAVAVTSAAIIVWYKINQRETESNATANKYKELNFEFEPPTSPWVLDSDLRNELGSPFILVYKRDNPDACMAIGVKDYDPRSPRESELQKGLMQALEKILDMATFRPDPSQMRDPWMGQEVKGFKFHAQLKDGTTVDGEACRIAYNGIGYWFLSWTGENNIYEEMKHEFAETRRHCKLLDFRKDWRERQSAIVPFKGDRVDYTIFDAEGIWEDDKDSDLKYEGEGADKVLRIKKGLKRGKKNDEIQDSKLVVYVLSRSGDPLEVARDHVTGLRQEEIKKGGADYKIDFTEITVPPEGDPIPNPHDITPAPILRLKSVVKGAANQNRLHVISAAKIEEKIVVVHAYTSLENKEILESLLIQIAGSLHDG